MGNEYSCKCLPKEEEDNEIETLRGVYKFKKIVKF
jgi:hypothetical protein